MRRLFDFGAALIGLLLTSPIWLVCLLALLLLDFGNPFFVHRRVGQGGREFGLVKFRTMRTSSRGANVTVAGDVRITPVGRVLRRLKLDELPQLLNVLAGQMSIVGPRPETADFVASYTNEQRKILAYKPGLTDPASLKYRHEEKILAKYPDPVDAYKSIVMPDKIVVSLDYQRRRTFVSDLTIIIRTIIAIFRSPASEEIA
jgi:lipopolysaccharide/colanic/teichoic acid biosynthesis glycosyltransferase